MDPVVSGQRSVAGTCKYGDESAGSGAWFKHFTYHLVPVLARNHKQHILSPAEVRKVRYSLAELYVRSVYLNLFGWRERELHETF
jgi:hypothetical protein